MAICKRCIVDSTVKGFHKTEKGCNFCDEYFLREKKYNKTKKLSKSELNKLVEKIKKSSRNSKYDCIIGVSGGIDSSWTLVKAVEMGLKPLAVHMDNSWNSELCQNNIKNLIKTLGVDFITYVIEWDEYKALMNAFFEADVIDIELLYDNAFLSVDFSYCIKNKVKYMLSGENHATEGMPLPRDWNWFKLDAWNIRAIAKKYGNVKISSFPITGIRDFFYFRYFKRLNWISLLDYIGYDKNEALRILIEKYKYKPYPQKHWESLFTRFYQGYILPEKFKVDKRMFHLSNLILSNQITREEALKEFNKPAYPSKELLNNDINYFIRKMEWTRDKLDDYIKRIPVPHDQYKSSRKIFEVFTKKMSFLKNLFYKK